MRMMAGIATAALLTWTASGATAAEPQRDGARPEKTAAASVSPQRRLRAVPRYTTRRYWVRTRGPYWGPYYRPWPSYGQYPYLYRPHYGWSGPIPGYRYGYTW